MNESKQKENCTISYSNLMFLKCHILKTYDLSHFLNHNKKEKILPTLNLILIVKYDHYKFVSKFIYLQFY